MSKGVKKKENLNDNNIIKVNKEIKMLTEKNN